MTAWEFHEFNFQSISSKMHVQCSVIVISPASQPDKRVVNKLLYTEYSPTNHTNQSVNTEQSHDCSSVNYRVENKDKMVVVVVTLFFHIAHQ